MDGVIGYYIVGIFVSEDNECRFVFWEIIKQDNRIMYSSAKPIQNTIDLTRCDKSKWKKQPYE